MTFHTYITYSEIFGNKPSESELNALIASLNKETTFKQLSMINNFLALFPLYLESDKEKFVYVQRFLAHNLLDEDNFEKLAKFVEHISLIDRPFFHRQQLLLLMKKVLLSASNDGGLNPNDSREARNILGTLCLMISDFTVNAEQDLRTQSENPYSNEENERVLNELLAQMLPTIELFNPPELSSAVTRTREYILLSSNFFPEAFDGRTLSSYFQSLTGVSLERFLHMVVGAHSAVVTKELNELIENPANFNISKSTYFSKLNYSDEEVNAFYELTTVELDKLILELESSPLRSILQMQYDFTVFRNHPLFHLGKDTLTSVDYSFLTEKVSIGLYYTVLNVLQKHNINPEDFFRHWGYVFEIYINKIFRDIYPETSHRFHPNTFYESRQRIEAFDGIIEYPNSLIVMQYKGGLLNTSAKYSDNVNLLLSEMDSKYGTKFNKSGISQLSRNIERLFNSNYEKRLKIRNLEFSNIRNVFPLLIVNDFSLQFGLANWRLKEWFKKEIETKNLENTVTIKPLMILTVEDLEKLTPYLEAEDFTLLEFVQFYSELEYVRFARFLIGNYWYEPMTTMGEVLLRFRRERDIKFRSNQRINEKWDEFMTEIKSDFKTEI